MPPPTTTNLPPHMNPLPLNMSKLPPNTKTRSHKCETHYRKGRYNTFIADSMPDMSLKEPGEKIIALYRKRTLYVYLLMLAQTCAVRILCHGAHRRSAPIGLPLYVDIANQYKPKCMHPI